LIAYQEAIVNPLDFRNLPQFSKNAISYVPHTYPPSGTPARVSPPIDSQIMFLAQMRVCFLLELTQKVTVHRFRVQRSELRTKKALKT
jgi:hypothetical protein